MDALTALPEGLEEVLESAARLQEMVPDAVLVGGSAASLYARHRMSTDHDHILTDLRDRFDVVLDALDRDGDWILNRASPGKIILGELGGIEAGVRQMIRTRPLEVQRVTLPSGRTLTVPTVDEIARIKGYLIVKRNQVRDYLDVAALSHKFTPERIGATLSGIDDYYSDDTHAADRPVKSQLARQLADPSPKDHRRIDELPRYKALDVKWHNWDAVIAECTTLAVHMSH
ncbi:MAG: hypothetical protein ABS62_06755 [Microbacterium sp. SCN 70-200]|nr:MAG: hypothetical protein ABS62_06755 [Microbacterium sp. SCN 70-200]OJV84190.1 MAG: hypothetical protein BGO46_13600 [Microbacterium sp. 70-16]